LNVLLLTAGYGVYSLAYTSLFKGAAILLYAVAASRYFINKDNVSLKFQLKYFKSFSRIFTYTFSSRLFDTIASNIDLILVSRYLGSHYVTILDLCRRPIKIVSGLSNNITISMLPALSHLFGEGDNKRIQTIVLRIWSVVLWLSGLITGGFILFNHSLITKWVGAEFWINNTNNVIMCISFFLLAIGYNLSNITYSMGDLKNNSLINIVRNVIYLVLLYFLAKSFGITGVLLAFAIPLFILLAYYPKKVVEIAFFSRDNLKNVISETSIILFILLACVVLSYSIPINVSFGWMIVLGVIFVFAYGGVVLLLSKGFQQEVSMIKKRVIPKIAPSKISV